MTNLLDLTAQLENGYFQTSNGFPNNNTGNPIVKTIPFYVDASGAINFGYGVLIPARTGQNPTATQQVEASLLAAGVPQAAINVLNQYFNGTATVQDVNNSLPLQDWRNVALVATDNYYTDVTTPALIKALGSAFYNLGDSQDPADF